MITDMQYRIEREVRRRCRTAFWSGTAAAALVIVVSWSLMTTWIATIGAVALAWIAAESVFHLVKPSA